MYQINSRDHVDKTTEEIPELKRKEFAEISLLGGGAQGQVYLMEHEITGKFAVKLFDTSYGTRVRTGTIREIEHIARMNRHDNIIRIFGFIVEELKGPKIGYFMEYMADGSLDKAIHDYSSSYLLFDALSWAFQASLALSWLHSTGIIHRDVKPSNMLLSNGQKALKLCDFGTTRSFEKTYTMTMGVGTILYMANELLIAKTSSSYTNKCDVYSLGVTIWEMMTRREPLGTGGLSGRPRIKRVLVQEIRDVLEHCFAEIPEDRPTMEQVAEKLKNLLNNSNNVNNNVLQPGVLYTNLFAKYPSSCTWSPNNDVMATCSEDSDAAVIWDFRGSLDLEPTSFQLKCRLLKHAPPTLVSRIFKEEHSISVLCWNYDGSLLATRDTNCQLIVWIPDGTRKCVLPRPMGMESGIHWNPQRNLILATNERTITLWDVEQSKEVQQFNSLGSRIIWMTDQLFLCIHEETINIFEIGTSDPIRSANISELNASKDVDFKYEPTSKTRRHVDFKYDPISKRLCFYHWQDDKTSRLWVLTDNLQLSLLSDVDSEISYMAWSPLGYQLACGCKEKSLVLVFDVRMDKVVMSLDDLQPYDVTKLKYSNDGQYLAAGGRMGNVLVWKTTTWSQVLDCQKYKGRSREEVLTLQWNSNNTKLAVGHYDGFASFEIIMVLDMERLTAE